MYGRWIEDFYAIFLSRGITIEISFRFYVEEKVVRIKRGRRRYLNRGMQSDDRRRSSFDAPYSPRVWRRFKFDLEQLESNYLEISLSLAHVQSWLCFSPPSKSDFLCDISPNSNANSQIKNNSCILVLFTRFHYRIQNDHRQSQLGSI